MVPANFALEVNTSAGKLTERGRRLADSALRQADLHVSCKVDGLIHAAGASNVAKPTRPVQMKCNLVALAVLALAAAACGSEPWGCGMGAACPAMADVNGARYAVSGAVDLPGIELHLAPYAQISNTNMAAALADLTAYSVTGVEPTVFLVARSNQASGGRGSFHELWSLADDPFPEGLCRFFDGARRADYSGCH